MRLVVAAATRAQKDGRMGGPASRRGGGREENKAKSSGTAIDRNWRFSKLDGVPMRFSSSWVVPMSGRLEVNL